MVTKFNLTTREQMRIIKISFLLSILILTSFSLIAQKTPTNFKNPILPGFHPDPSICRVNDNYYMVTSSFEWFPGLPIFKSKDLVNWEQIGHVLDRPSQLQMKEGMGHSRGLWAPTIRFNKGKYYVICTAVDCGGNFFVTADNPEGPYSEPIFIADSPGMDPSLFFDDDGKCWFSGCHNGPKPDQKYPGEDRIYIQELDLKTGQLIGDRTIATSGHAINAPNAEAPHIYKINGQYYLIVAEGSTWENHAVTMFVSDKVNGKYTPFITNPLLTHRHLGNQIDITTIGHADMVQTQNGDWWAVMLGVRPIEGYNMLGRETFLTPVIFQGDIPIFNPGIGRVLMNEIRPNLSYSPVQAPPMRDEFTDKKLKFCWNFLRTPFDKWYTLDSENGGSLIMDVRPNRVQDRTNPSLIARRIEHHNYDALCAMTFEPKGQKEEAGMIVLQNNKFNYRLVLMQKEKTNFIQLYKTEAGNQILIAESPYQGNNICLAIKGEKLKCSFFFGINEKHLKQLGELSDATILSSNKAGGFIGPYIGMYCSSNGELTKNKAIFDWFEYHGK